MLRRWSVPCGAALCLMAVEAIAQEMPTSLDAATRLARSLEAMALRGELSDGDLRGLTESVYALWPDARYAEPPRALCGYEAVHQARAFAREGGAPVLRLPPPASDVLYSSRYPIRVYHNDALLMAQSVLSAAEDAWRNQIEDVGYPVPHTDGDEGPVVPGTWYYISYAAGALAYAEPLADVASTPRCDCSSRIVVDPDNSLASLPAIIAHEFNHATQIATDCTEAISAFENFATAVMTHYFPDEFLPLQFISYFQMYPEWPVDYWTRTAIAPSSNYQYGAALFPIYLDARFGERDLRFLRTLWNAFAQNGSVELSPAFQVLCTSGDEPHWFEGVDSILQRTRSVSLDEAFDEFSTWRAVTGPYDDGAHFPNGANYPTVPTTQLSLATPPASVERAVHEYGSTHILLTGAAPANAELRIEVDPGATFAASLLRWRTGGAVETTPIAFSGQSAAVPAPSLDGFDRAVLAVSQRSDGNYDPYAMQYSTTRAVRVAIVLPLPPDAGVGIDSWDPTPFPDPEDPDAGLALEGEALLVAASRDCACRIGATGPAAAPSWWLLLALTLSIARSVRARRGGRVRRAG